MFHTQEVQGSGRSAEAQGSEMSRALLAQTPGVTGLQQVLKGQKLSQEKEAKRGRSSAYTDSAQLRSVRCIRRQSLFYEVANYLKFLVFQSHYPILFSL